MPDSDPQPPGDDPPAPALSELLRSLCDGPPGPTTVREIVDHFGQRAFGAMLFVFSVPNLLPLPPGSSTVLGLPLVVISPQLGAGVKSPWLPRLVAERVVERGALRQVFERLIPQLERVEKLLAPRLGFMFGPLGDRLIGLICFLLSLILILPIPLGNMLPAGAVSVFALSLTQRDGAFALLGYFLTTVSIGVLVFSASAVAAAVKLLINFFGG